jgi:glycosyltransferase involved in cell wall biosynthesis
MKICFLANAVSPHTRYWTRYFHGRGHQVSVISLLPAEPDEGIELYVLPQKRQVRQDGTNWQYLFSLGRLRRLLRRIRPDVLNAHYLASYGLLGALVRPAGCRFVVSLHGTDILITPRRSPLHAAAARFALGRAELVTSVAEHMTRVLPRYVSPDKPVLTLQYGIRTERFHPPGDAGERDPLAVCTRRLVSIANIDTLLDAAAVLERAGSPLRFELCNWGELRESLERRCAELGLAGRVRFLGRVDQDTLARSLRAAALYVSMTSSDGASLSLLEAMACGAFPVVSDIPANREWIRDGENGMLVPLDDPELLARKLDEAWRSVELRRAAAPRNWELVREKGDYETNMGRIESAFVDLAAGRAVAV